MDAFARVAGALGRFSRRFVPSAFAIAILLTVLTAALAAVTTGAGPGKLLEAWGGGFWFLVPFAMRMALVMFTGYVLAVSAPVSAALRAAANLPRSPRQAAVFMALASMGLALLNWGLSIVGSAVLVRHVAKRNFGAGRRADYPLLVACAYFGLGATWHAGLSASAPLIAATPAEAITKEFGVVPVSETLFSGFNLGLVAASVALLAVLAFVLHPKEGAERPVDPAVLDTLRSFEPPPRETGSLAAFFDHTPWLNLAFGACALGYAGTRLARDGWGKLDIDLVNLIFLALGVLAHRTPAALLKASEEASGVLGGIVLQFPLYAGVYGIFQATGLTNVIGDFFVRHASPGTFPAVVYWYSGLVNYFVPSGGVKWTIEAPYILKAAKTMGVPSAKMVLAYAWGDMATDLIQPFWALPLLSVARLEFRDILGYLLVACAAYVVLVSAAFLLFA